MNLERAATYSDRHGGQALFVAIDGVTVFERFGNGFESDTSHALYSGTKSFWGICAGVARDAGMLSLDETVGDTFAAWAAGERAAVTLRDLLHLTSGIGFGGLGNAVPTYEKALAVELKTVPGSTFTYGGIPLQVFGAVLARKLQPFGLTPHAFLRERILDPIGCVIDRWRTLADGTQPLPTGAFMRAAEWAKFGTLVASGGLWNGRALISADALLDCFEGSHPNPRYGLGWWLSPFVDRTDLAYASGSGGQAMYVLRAERAVVVRFGSGGSFKHEAFVKLLLAAEEPRTAARKTRS